MVGALGFIALTRLDAHAGLAILIAATIVFSLGLAPLTTLTPDLIFASAPPERAGATSGISETCAELGGALGIAIFGSIGIATYRATLPATLPDIPVDAMIVARDTLGGAIAIAAQLPSQAGSQLVEVARQVFLRGFHLSAANSAAGSLGLAVFAAVTLRRVRSASSSTH